MNRAALRVRTYNLKYVTYTGAPPPAPYCLPLDIQRCQAFCESSRTRLTSITSITSLTTQCRGTCHRSLRGIFRHWIPQLHLSRPSKDATQPPQPQAAQRAWGPVRRAGMHGGISSASLDAGHCAPPPTKSKPYPPLIFVAANGFILPVPG